MRGDVVYCPACGAFGGKRIEDKWINFAQKMKQYRCHYCLQVFYADLEDDSPLSSKAESSEQIPVVTVHTDLPINPETVHALGEMSRLVVKMIEDRQQPPAGQEGRG